MRIFLGQINPIIGDINNNTEKIISVYKKGENLDADLVIFPELSICGYPPLDLLEKKEFRKEIKIAINYLASKTNSVGLLLGGINEVNTPSGIKIYNSAIFCYDNKVQFIQHKSLIPNYDVFDEVRYFEPASKVDVFEFKGEKLGISICEDIWNDADYWESRRYIDDPIKSLVDKGASIILNLSASPYSYGYRKQRKNMLSELSKKIKCSIAYVCCTGAQTDLIFDGGSMCFDPYGNLVKLGKVFSEDSFLFDTKKSYEVIEKCERSFPEEVLDALICGLKDYAYKTGFSKVLIGLSGGIDSALVTYIAVEALGKENVHVLLLPSQYSSEGSLKDSEKLIDNLGISSNTISIASTFNEAIKNLEPIFKSLPQNVAEENLQSRIRGIYLMAISNKFNFLLCTTGNKSEMATGYATLYGDMNGALSIIGDVYKTEVYSLCNYINREQEIIPQEIIEKAPSAELRPDQKDEDTLPPYELLDKILKMYLEEGKEIEEINSNINDLELVKKILTMVDRNEFKRKQSAPVLRVTKKSFGSGRRFPIVQKWQR